MADEWQPFTEDWLAPDETRCALCGDVSPTDDLVRREIDEPGVWGMICQGCEEQLSFQDRE